jgi:hypothetical protein
LRDREIVSVARYQKLFREFIAEWMGSAPEDALRAELISAAVVSAHNHVLRRWLRKDTDDSAVELDVAMARVAALFTGTSESESEGGSVVVVLRDRRHPREVAAVARHALERRA